MTGANERNSRDGILLAVLNELERRYEKYSSKLLGRERSKSLALSVVSNFRHPAPLGASPRGSPFSPARVYFAGIAKIRDY